MNEEEYYTVGELARHYNVSKTTIRRGLISGKVFSSARKTDKKLGQRWLVPSSDVGKVSLKDLAPLKYQEKIKNSSADKLRAEKPFFLDTRVAILEDRVAFLERRLRDALSGI